MVTFAIFFSTPTAAQISFFSFFYFLTIFCFLFAAVNSHVRGVPYYTEDLAVILSASCCSSKSLKGKVQSPNV